MERVRKNFAKAPVIIEPPHLISMQRISYEKFLQIDVEPNERQDFGLQAIFKNVFPINDFNGHCSLEFVSYSFGVPKYTIAECQQRGMTFDIPVKITVRLITFDVDEETEVQTIRDIKEQQVFLGALPLMTGDGVFVINGTERAIVFTGIRYGRSPMIAIRVHPVKPTVVVYHRPGSVDSLAIKLADRENIPLVVTNLPLEDLKKRLVKLGEGE